MGDEKTMTKEELERLPALLPRKVFLQLTGITDDDLYALIKRKQIKVFRRPWRRRCVLYYKSEAIRLARIAM